MNFKMNKYFVLAQSGLLALSFATSTVTPVSAATHSLSTYVNDASTRLTTLHLTMSVDWDLNNPPAGRDKAYIQAILNQFALSTFTMTEGRMRVGTVRVYQKSRYMDNVDIQLLNKEGRANASISGWGRRGMTTTQFSLFNGREETPVQLGKTIAHEWGHYGFGLFDEYREASDPNKPVDAGSPQGGDTPRNSMMNNHEEFLSFSMDADYEDTSQRKTAHYRIFGQSAWATLIANPTSDPSSYMGVGYPMRPAWPSLIGWTMPTPTTLAKPTAGYDAALKFEYMGDGNSVQVIVIDRAQSAVNFTAAKQAAEQFVRRAQDTSRVAILAYPDSVDTPVLDMTVTDAAGKDRVTQVLAALTTSAVSGNVDAALSAALTRVNAAKSASDTPAVLLYTATTTEVAETVANDYRNATVALSPIAVDSPAARVAQKARGLADGSKLRKAAAGKKLLSEVAEQTRGSYKHSHNGADLVSAAIKASADAEGEVYALVSEGASGELTPGQSFELPIQVGAASVDGAITFSLGAEVEDYPRLQLRLTDPAGKSIDPASPPVGISVQRKADEGLLDVIVLPSYSGRQGVWKAKLTATQTVDNAAVQVFSDSKLMAEAGTVGGTASDRRVLALQVEIKGPLPVTGARVLVDVYDDAGKKVLSGLSAADDGKYPDARAGDGVYSVDLGSRLPLGEFEAVFFVDNPSGNAKFTTSGQRRSGSDAPSESMGSFLRANEIYFVHAVKGVAPTPVLQAIEFYNTPLNHYFYTAYPGEQQSVDTGGAGPGWSRTGQSFNVFPVEATPSVATNPVCRFYGTPGIGPNSHFYTSNPAECAGLRSQGASRGWTYEGVTASLPSAAAPCPAEMKPIYRNYNNRFAQNDSNHRMTTDKATYDAMIARGWSGEGVVACAAP